MGGAHVQAGGGEPGGGQEMVPVRPHLGGRSDIDTGGSDSRPPTAETAQVQSQEEDSREERCVSMVAEVGEDRQHQARLSSTTDGIPSE